MFLTFLISIGFSSVFADTFFPENKECFQKRLLIFLLSKKGAKIWIKKFTYYRLKERNCKKLYQVKIIDAETHPRKMSEKVKKKNTLGMMWVVSYCY